jgi:hypothetical protein
MNHAWNMVKLDGKYYHVDVTFDDPARDNIGSVRHDYFLVSDDTIKAGRTPHYGWTSSVAADSTKYENYFWKNVNTGVIYNKGSLYYIDKSGNLKQRDVKTDKEKVLDTISDKWKVFGKRNYYYSGNFSTIALSNNKLYYNGVDKIYSIDLDGQNKKLVKQIDSSNGCIYGLAVQDGKLKYSIKQDPNADVKETLYTVD